MRIEKAQQMMAEAVMAMLQSGQYQVAQTVAAQTTVAGQVEHVMCIVLGPSQDVLDAIASRIGDASIDERVSWALASDVISQAAKG